MQINSTESARSLRNLYFVGTVFQISGFWADYGQSGMYPELPNPRGDLLYCVGFSASSRAIG
jgi:hypothetical protein